MPARSSGPAKLWCDTESAAQNAQLVAQLGGEAGCLERLGLVPATGYTLSKLLWLKQHEPEAFGRIGTILLPHDYLNYWLTGECAAERGDASGTGYFDVRTRRWAPEVLALIAPDGRLERALPRLLRAEEPVATVRPALARELGLAEGVLVASGGGDNMMGAIGTGNIADGIVTLSLGTSGALYACTERPPVLSSPLVAPFCSSSNAWLPLICTMNLTGVVHQVRTLFGYDLERFQQEADRAGIGAGGITLLPFLNGERVPALPRASGSLLGLNTQNLTPANLCRAALEGTTFGLRHGLDLLRASGIRCDSIRLIGGGARSPLWRRLVAEILDTQVVCPRVGEAAALGAAIQAAWCEQHQRGTGVSLAELCGRFVALDPDSAVTPEAGAVARYRDAYQRYRRHLNQLHPDA